MENTFLWGFIATLVLTSVLRYSQVLRLTRMDLPFLIGAAFTPDRDRAKLVGFGVHLLNGWAIAFLYWAIFRSLGFSSAWLGALLGLFQGAVVLGLFVPLLPAAHPRMAKETHAPDATPSSSRRGSWRSTTAARRPSSPCWPTSSTA